MHPAEDIRGIKSNKLSNKKIILGVTGSIAAIESIKLARELIRHDACVYPVMSKSATKIIHPDSLEYATSEIPVLELTGQTEHVMHCGITKNQANLMIIYPCTANTISKIAHGIDDTPVTTFATTAIGSGIPVIIVPAMHLSMYNNRILKENINKLKKIGIKFINPKIINNIAKIPEFRDIVEYCIREIGKKDFKSKKILIIGGATADSLDDVRIITNRSSGKTAVSLAKIAFERGANVELWYGYSSKKTPSFVETKNFRAYEDLFNLLKQSRQKFDIVVVCAAIADYLPVKQKGKIPSKKDKLVIEFFPTQKIIGKIKSRFPKAKIIAFKLEENKSNLKKKSYDLLKSNNLDFVVGNTISSLENEKSEVLIVDKEGKSKNKVDRKEEIASYILDVIKD